MIGLEDENVSIASTLPDKLRKMPEINAPGDTPPWAEKVPCPLSKEKPDGIVGIVGNGKGGYFQIAILKGSSSFKNAPVGPSFKAILDGFCSFVVGEDLDSGQSRDSGQSSSMVIVFVGEEYGVNRLETLSALLQKACGPAG